MSRFKDKLKDQTSTFFPFMLNSNDMNDLAMIRKKRENEATTSTWNQNRFRRPFKPKNVLEKSHKTQESHYIR